MKDEKWECSECGDCCEAMGQYIDNLNRGDGVCKHFDMSARLCRVYEERPLICQIDKAYDKLYKNEFINKQHYYEVMRSFCNKENL